jgi:Cys-tRNA(Pro) deacylase
MPIQAHISETPATALLRKHQVAFTEHVYAYVPHGGTTQSAKALGLDEHHIVKTLVMQDENAQPFIIVMHGDCEVSTKALARQIGCKRVEPCKPEVAERHTGYQVGGTSPFGTRLGQRSPRKPLRVYVQHTVLALERCYINGGKRGYLIGIAPHVLITLLNALAVDCALTSI